MKAALSSVALCLALASSLAHAQDLHPGLALDLASELQRRDPAPPGAVVLQGLLGLVGGVAMSIPGAMAGYFIGDILLPPGQSCDLDGCDVGYPLGGELGLLAGSVIGLAFGTGLGVAGAGSLQGGAFHLASAILGAGAGAVVALGTCLALSFAIGSFLYFTPWVPAGAIALGAVVGSVSWYQESHPFGEPAAPPAPAPAPPAATILLVRGGAVMHVAGTF